MVGWQTSTNTRTGLALNMGLWQQQRAGQDITGLIHHSDRGVQYRAIRYTERLAEADAVASVGSKGDSYDNATAETFHSLFKAEGIRNPVMRPKGGWAYSATPRSPSRNTSTDSITVDSTARSGSSHPPKPTPSTGHPSPWSNTLENTSPPGPEPTNRDSTKPLRFAV